MILKDFLSGGFRISRRAPVLCFLGSRVSVVYNNADLAKALAGKEKPTLIGVWPGKRNTDCFVLDPSCYGKIVPPLGDEDIDSAESVYVFFDDGIFDRVEYVPGPHATDRTTIVSRDPALHEYINNANIYHKNIYGKGQE